MKKFFINQNGKLFTYLRVLVMVLKPVKVVDSIYGAGCYGMQINFSNPNDPRKFQQNILQIGVNSGSCFWNRTLNVLPNSDPDVNYETTQLPDDVKAAVANFGHRLFQCVIFEVTASTMSIQIIDLLNGGVLYQNSVAWDMMPILAAEVAICGYGDCSIATFTDAAFEVTVTMEEPPVINVIDSDADFWTNLDALNVGGTQIESEELTGEGDNLSSEFTAGQPGQNVAQNVGFRMQSQ